MGNILAEKPFELWASIRRFGSCRILPMNCSFFIRVAQPFLCRQFLYWKLHGTQQVLIARPKPLLESKSLSGFMLVAPIVNKLYRVIPPVESHEPSRIHFAIPQEAGSMPYPSRPQISHWSSMFLGDTMVPIIE